MHQANRQAGISILSAMIAMFIVTLAVIAGSKALVNYLEVTNRVRGKDLLSQVEDVLIREIQEKVGGYLEEKHAYIEAAGNAVFDIDQGSNGQYAVGAKPDCGSVIDLDEINWGQATRYFSIDFMDTATDFNFADEPDFYTAAKTRCVSDQKRDLQNSHSRLYFCLRVDPTGQQQQRSVLEQGPMLVEVSYTLWNNSVGVPLSCEDFFGVQTRAGAIIARMYWRFGGDQAGTPITLQTATASFVSKTHI